MELYVSYLHSDMIKQYDNGGLESVVDSVTQKYLINYTTLRSFIPPQVRKITPILRQICGYQLCIIPKDLHNGLNIFITNLVTYLQQKSVGVHTLNSEYINKSPAHYKKKLFPYGDFLHANIKDAAQ